MRLVWYIGLHVIFHGYTTKSYPVDDGNEMEMPVMNDVRVTRVHNLRQNTTPVEYFCIQVGQIGHHENKNWLDHADVICESCYKA